MRRPRAEPWMRVDELAYLEGTHLGLREAQRLVAEIVQPHPLPAPGAALAGYILQGFGFTVVPGPPDSLSVGLGTSARALLSETEDAAIYHGILASDELGSGAVIVAVADFWGGVAGDYDVYIRFTTQPGEAGNRAFWDPTTPLEYIGSMDCRDLPLFELAGIATGGGLPAGWTTGLMLCTVTVNAVGAITGIAGHRRFLFEGLEDSATPYSAEWGDGALDRDPDRAANGIHDLFTFAQYTRRQIKDILGPAQAPWTAVLNNLPSLETLGIQHWPTNHVWAGRHKSITLTESGMVYPSISLIPNPALAAPSLVFQQLLTDCFLMQQVGGDFATLVKTAAAGQSGGLILTGPQGYNADMGAGEWARLGFGRGNHAPWSQARDFGIVAYGGAADANRILAFTVGDPIQDRFLFYGSGQFWSASHVMASGNVVAYDVSSEFSYTVARTRFRSFSPAAFVPYTRQVAIGNALVLRGPDAFASGAIAQGIWTLSCLAAPAYDGWIILEPQGGDAAAGTVPEERLEAPLDFPNGAIIPVAGAAKQPGILISTSAAWTGDLAVAIARKVSNAVGTLSYEILAYVIYANATIPAGTTPRLIVNGNWTTTGFYAAPLNHTDARNLCVLIFADRAGGGARWAGEVKVHGVQIPFDVQTFQS